MLAAAAGLGGVALLVLTPKAALDPVGVAAGQRASMALGTVLSRRWQPPVSALTFTSWQLTAGILLAPPWPSRAARVQPAERGRHRHLGLIGAASHALCFAAWRGTGRGVLAGLSQQPVAVLLGWGVLGQETERRPIGGMAVVVASVWLNQRAQRMARPATPHARQAETACACMPPGKSGSQRDGGRAGLLHDRTPIHPGDSLSSKPTIILVHGFWAAPPIGAG